jgi:hypothetical protein
VPQQLASNKALLAYALLEAVLNETFFAAYLFYVFIIQVFVYSGFKEGFSDFLCDHARLVLSEKCS